MSEVESERVREGVEEVRRKGDIGAHFMKEG